MDDMTPHEYMQQLAEMTEQCSRVMNSLEIDRELEDFERVLTFFRAVTEYLEHRRNIIESEEF